MAGDSLNATVNSVVNNVAGEHVIEKAFTLEIAFDPVAPFESFIL